MNNVKFVNIVKLVMEYNLVIDSKDLSNNFKCVKCKLILTDACQVPCGCRFCRVCISDLMASGSEFCPGVSEDCGESVLSGFVTDYSTNKNISKLPIKCPQNGCLHQCQLAELEDHVSECQRGGVACPFHEWGCQQDKLTAEEINGHLQQENYNHSKMLIAMITDLKREIESYKKEIEMLKRIDETNRSEIELLKISDESNKREIEMLKSNDERNKSEINILKSSDEINKREIEVLKRSDESNKSEIEMLKRSDESNKIEIERLKRGEGSTSNEILIQKMDDINKEMESYKREIEILKSELVLKDGQIKPVIDQMGHVENEIKLNKDDFYFIKSKMQSMQALVTTGLVDANVEWVIDEDLKETRWVWLWGSTRASEYFTGSVQLYKYRLTSANIDSRNKAELQIYLHIVPGVKDSRLTWPFRGTVAITVTDKINRESCQSITRHCEICKPANNSYSSSDRFTFRHAPLIEAGIDLGCGVYVSCMIVISRDGR